MISPSTLESWLLSLSIVLAVIFGYLVGSVLWPWVG